MPKKNYWNLRVMKFSDPNAADENACNYRLVEVYYEDDVPHSWCEYFTPVVESWDLPEQHDSLDVTKALSLEYVRHLSNVHDALSKPILDASTFEK